MAKINKYTEKIVGYFKGVIFCFLWYTSICAGFFIFFCPSYLLLLLSNSWYRWYTDLVFSFWEYYPTALLELCYKTKIFTYGSPFRKKDRGSLFLMNHRTRLDWNYAWLGLHALETDDRDYGTDETCDEIKTCDENDEVNYWTLENGDIYFDSNNVSTCKDVMKKRSCELSNDSTIRQIDTDRLDNSLENIHLRKLNKVDNEEICSLASVCDVLKKEVYFTSKALSNNLNSPIKPEPKNYLNSISNSGLRCRKNYESKNNFDDLMNTDTTKVDYEASTKSSVFSFKNFMRPTHNMKYVLKDEIKHLPGPGWVMQMCSFPYIKRNWAHDRDQLIETVRYLSEISGANFGIREYDELEKLRLMDEEIGTTNTSDLEPKTATNLGNAEAENSKIINDNCTNMDSVPKVLTPRTTIKYNIRKHSNYQDQVILLKFNRILRTDSNQKDDLSVRTKHALSNYRKISSKYRQFLKLKLIFLKMCKRLKFSTFLEFCSRSKNHSTAIKCLKKYLQKSNYKPFYDGHVNLLTKIYKTDILNELKNCPKYTQRFSPRKLLNMHYKKALRCRLKNELLYSNSDRQFGEFEDDFSQTVKDGEKTLNVSDKNKIQPSSAGSKHQTKNKSRVVKKLNVKTKPIKFPVIIKNHRKRNEYIYNNWSIDSILTKAKKYNNIYTRNKGKYKKCNKIYEANDGKVSQGFVHCNAENDKNLENMENLKNTHIYLQKNYYNDVMRKNSDFNLTTKNNIENCQNILQPALSNTKKVRFNKTLLETDAKCVEEFQNSLHKTKLNKLLNSDNKINTDSKQFKKCKKIRKMLLKSKICDEDLNGDYCCIKEKIFMEEEEKLKNNINHTKNIKSLSYFDKMKKYYNIFDSTNKSIDHNLNVIKRQKFGKWIHKISRNPTIPRTKIKYVNNSVRNYFKQHKLIHNNKATNQKCNNDVYKSANSNSKPLTSFETILYDGYTTNVMNFEECLSKQSLTANRISYVSHSLKVDQIVQENDLKKFDDGILDSFDRRPFQLLIFPEGTDLSKNTLRKAHEYARSKNKPLYNHVLHPRPRGFCLLVRAMGACHSLDSVYDITVAYRKTVAQNEMDAVKGHFPEEVHFLFRRYSGKYLNSLSDVDLRQWLERKWSEKEQILQEFHKTGTFPYRKLKRNISKIRLTLALIFWTILVFVHMYLLYSNSLHWRWWCLFHSCLMISIRGFNQLEIRWYKFKKWIFQKCRKFKIL